MTYGFKCYDASGNIICDGTSLMLMLHASGSQYIIRGNSWTFSYAPLNHEPVFVVQCDPFSEDWESDHVKTGADWTGVKITNRGSALASDSTFDIFVYRRN